MATLTREDEKVISRKSQSSSAAESEAEKADGEDSDSFTRLIARGNYVSVLYNSQMIYSC